MQRTGREVPNVQNGIASDSFHGVDHTMDVPLRALVEGA